MMPARPDSGRSAARARERDHDPASTLDDLLDLVLPNLPAVLIAPKSASRVRDAVAGVPPELVARFGLECRLAAPSADADVLLCADSETGGMQMLAGRHPLVSLPDSLATAERWAPVIRFCARREPGLLLHRATREAWLDLSRPHDPSFSFGMRLQGLPEATRRPLEILIRALEIGLDALRGAPLAPPALTSMRSLVRRLPETARVERAGLVAGLPDDVRLWLSRLSAGELVDLVEVTRERSEARALHAVLDEIVQPAGSVRARIDIHHGVERGGAVIYSVDDERSAAHVGARWRPLLDRLVDAGLCASDTRDALLSCHGVLRERQTEGWPAHLTRLSELFGQRTESILHWHLQHVEIECDRGEPVQARAHIAVAHGWSRR